MYDMILAITFMGFGVGYEGYNDGKLYIGAYTPTREYGWVVEGGEIHLDTILEKNQNNS